MSNTASKRIARGFCISLVSLAGVCLGGRPSFAQTTNWTDGTGDWFNAANWDSGIPAAGMTANVINGGAAQIAGAASAGTLNINTGSSAVILQSGGSLNATTITIGILTHSHTASDGVLQIGSGGSLAPTTAISVLGGGLFDLNGHSQTIGDLSIGVGAISGGTVTLGSGTLTAGTANSTTVFGVISGSGSFVKQGSGTLTLKEFVSTYTGGTTINAGTLQLGPGSGLASSGNVTMNGGTFDVNVHNQTIGDLSGTGTILVNGGLLTVGTANSTTFGGNINDGGLGHGATIGKQGTGTLTLTGTVIGSATVSAGTLQIGNGGTVGGVTVANGGTLSGTGTVGATSVASGGTIAPGNASVGTLAANGAVAFASGSN